MRDRLIGLLNEATFGVNVHTLADHLKKETIEAVADYLIANGVIVPPCKVGDTVFEIADMSNHKAFSHIVWSDTITKIGVTTKGILHEKGIDFADFGKTVFLTREEAEKALKGGGEG